MSITLGALVTLLMVGLMIAALVTRGAIATVPSEASAPSAAIAEPASPVPSTN